MPSFIRWNENTQIWEKAVNPNVTPPTWNHLPVANPTLALDIANKQYVDAAVSGVSGFVPYVGATANVNLGNFSLAATLIKAGSSAFSSGPTPGLTTNAGFLLGNLGFNFGLLGGVNNNGDSWLQVQRTDNFNTDVYNLNLQPRGGRVTIGFSNTADDRLLIVGGGALPTKQAIYAGVVATFNNAAQFTGKTANAGVEGGILIHSSGAYFGSWTNTQVIFRVNDADVAYFNTNGVFSVYRGFAMPGMITPPMPTTIFNDWNPAGLSTAALINVTHGVPTDITGLMAQEDGRLITFICNSGATLRFMYGDPGSASNNRFNALPGGTNLTLTVLQSATFRMVAGSGWWLVGRT